MLPVSGDVSQQLNMGYFAHKQPDGTIDQCIVIDASEIASGHWGNPSEWIEYKKDGSTRKNPAEIGGKYDAALDAFVFKKEYNSWILDEDTAKWKAPKEAPLDGKVYEWDEVKLDWLVYKPK